MNAQKTFIPSDLLVNTLSNCNHDYSDCFSIMLMKNCNIKPFAERFFTQWPNWVFLLFKIRRVVVAPFGLRTNQEVQKTLLNQAYNLEKGGKAGLFNVIEMTDDEVVLFLGDKHLDAWLSVAKKQQGTATQVYVSTIVKYHYWFGRVYFFMIKPFHKIIIKQQLKTVASIIHRS